MKNKNVKKWGSIRRSPRGSRGQRLLELAFLKFQEAAVPHPWNGPTTVPKQEQLSDLRGLSGCQDCQLHSWKQNPSRAAPPMMRCRAKERSPGDKEKPLRSGNRPGKPHYLLQTAREVPSVKPSLLWQEARRSLVSSSSLHQSLSSPFPRVMGGGINTAEGPAWRHVVRS